VIFQVVGLRQCGSHRLEFRFIEPDAAGSGNDVGPFQRMNDVRARQEMEPEQIPVSFGVELVLPVRLQQQKIPCFELMGRCSQRDAPCSGKREHQAVRIRKALNPAEGVSGTDGMPGDEVVFFVRIFDLHEFRLPLPF